MTLSLVIPHLYMIKNACIHGLAGYGAATASGINNLQAEKAAAIAFCHFVVLRALPILLFPTSHIMFYKCAVLSIDVAAILACRYLNLIGDKGMAMFGSYTALTSLHLFRIL